MQKAYVCDIDGTVADNSRRQIYVENRPKDWISYNAFMPYDTPIQPVIDTINMLFSCGVPIILFTGRQERHRKVTEDWLAKYGVNYSELYMRPTDNHEDDADIKERMLAKIDSKYDIIGVFEDRKKVKRRWVKLGIFVFDVNQKDKEF